MARDPADANDGLQPARWRGGRPALPAGERRSVALPRVRVTPSELEAVRTRAAQLGLPVAELIRGAVLDRHARPAVPQVNREAWGRLGPLAANLNQWVKAIHEGRASGAPRRLLEELRAAVSDLRRALLGRAEPPP
jgi:hypothetical protein